MASKRSDKQIIKGGEFLVKETDPQDIFIPEEKDEEQKMIMDMCREFINTEVIPIFDKIENKEEGLIAGLLGKAGEQGLLGTSVPEEFGGFGKDFDTSVMLTEALGPGQSFTVTLITHTGIGTLPILYFGTEKQKKKYLPKLATGELKAAYCLTEAGSGSDALSAASKAVLSKDKKHYVLTGEKMWITNAGFADVFTVFAQVDGDKFTGFIIERDYKGITFGEEEHKMGIKGSSTRQIFFEDCKVPVENVLGEIGKGHLIAFNILNIGRLKLAAAALGGAKKATSLSVSYANERHQFKQPISNFGAIQYKLAEQAIQTYALESALYRVSHNITLAKASLEKSGKKYAESVLGAAEEYAVECAILKVFGSEVLDYVVDEGVQVYGGYGFSAEYPMDMFYRDSRVNRIFEGTNEINRLLSIGMLLKRAMKGEIDIMGPAQAIQKELMSIPDFGSEEEGLFVEEKKAIKNMKKAVLMAAGAAAMKFMKELENEQEIIMDLADMLIQTYVAESVLLRTEKLVGMQDEKKAKYQIDMAKVYIFDAMDKINRSGKNAIVSFAEGDELRMILMGLKRFTKIQPVNTKELRRHIAKKMIEENKYCF